MSLVPLASDLKLLRGCLILRVKAAKVELQKKQRYNEKMDRYEKQLKKNIRLQTIFCRIMLLNRKRPAELQRLFIKTYQSAFFNTQSHEKFSEDRENVDQ